MNIHDITVGIQYITIAALFVEMWIVYKKWKNSIHSYLLFACISSFISNLGYLFELKATTEEGYLFALKLSYAGRVFIVLALFLFSARLCRIMIPKGVSEALILLHVGIYITVLTIGKNTLYYKDYRFDPDPLMPRLYKTDGTVHDLLMVLNAVLTAFALWWIIREYKKERSGKSKQRLFMLILAFGVEAAFFVIQVTGAFKISDYYDLTMPGVLLGTVFMLIAILGFDLLGTREIARDFVIDRISEGIIAVDNDGRIQYYNEPAAKLYPEFGTFFEDDDKNDKKDEKPSVIKRSLSKIYTPYDILSLISDAVDNNETININDRIYTPERNDLIYKGECYGKLYALVDDTEHYRYMEELKKQKDIADNANEAKSRFLASMSHEIRTPINAVLGMDEMILRESGEKTIRSYAADIMSAGKTLLSLINDILDLSKVEEGKMEIITVQYDLSSLINDLVNMIRDRADKKGLKFGISADEHIPHILMGDEIRIRQCVMNLLTNAVKYTEKGTVSLDITFVKKSDDHIDLKFCVEDTGIGMKEEDMENLFSPYKRIEEKRNRSIEGTGLGMSITRQLLSLMGSRLDVKSTYGEGSVFSFVIDQEVVKWEELGDYSSRFNDISNDNYEYHELFHAPDARILVVDDTEMNLTVITSLLKKTKIRIDTASSGMDAVTLAKDVLYDVIFIDHMMPDMDGIETLMHIREGGMSKDTPAVALTANAVSGARKMYLDAGFTDYLSKPVDGERLEKMLSLMIPEDKLLPADDDTEDDSVKEDMRSLDELEAIDEIDVKAGLKNCGSEEGYLSVLSVFHQTAGQKADEIEELLNKGDIDNYTIKVHALKSSARIIGASELSGHAKDLEDAGKRNDTGYISENNEKLLMLYRELDRRLKFLDPDDKDLLPIDEGALKEAYQTIYEIAGSMDYGMMEDIIKDLKKYRLPGEDKENILKIEGMLNNLDWDGIIDSVNERGIS